MAIYNLAVIVLPPCFSSFMEIINIEYIAVPMLCSIWWNIWYCIRISYACRPLYKYLSPISKSSIKSTFDVANNDNKTHIVTDAGSLGLGLLINIEPRTQNQTSSVGSSSIVGPVYISASQFPGASQKLLNAQLRHGFVLKYCGVKRNLLVCSRFL